MNALMAIAMAKIVLQPMPKSLSFIQRDKKTVFLPDKTDNLVMITHIIQRKLTQYING
jgi:hypothetical protein